MAVPDKLRIPCENFEGARFEFVGRFGNGNQFMAYVTGAFPGRERFPSADHDWRAIKSWNAVIHCFDTEGNHIGTEARRGGYDIEGREVAGDKAWQYLDSMLLDLGSLNPSLCDIYIKPFSVTLDDVIYSLEYESYIDEEDGSMGEYVMLWPNDIMFHPPWDSGNYST